jgi:hypothetical protein
MRYKDSVDVFSKDMAETLAPHEPTDHMIDLEAGFNLQYGGIYNHSEFELTTLSAYVARNLGNGFRPQSSSPMAAPILFAKQHDSGI